MRWYPEGLPEYTVFLRLGRVEPIPAFRLQRVAAQFVVAGYSPDIGVDLIFFRQDLMRAKSLVKDENSCSCPVI